MCANHREAAGGLGAPGLLAMLVCGALFGFGLALSTMVSPAVVLSRR